MIKTYLFLISTIFVFLILQISFLPAFNMYLIWPNLILLFILILFLLVKDDESPQQLQVTDLFWLLLIGGFLADIFSVTFFGFFTLSYLFLGFCVYFLTHGVIDPGVNLKSSTMVVAMVGLAWPLLYSILNQQTISLALMSVTLLATIIFFPLFLSFAKKILYV